MNAAAGCLYGGIWLSCMELFHDSMNHGSILKVQARNLKACGVCAKLHFHVHLPHLPTYHPSLETWVVDHSWFGQEALESKRCIDSPCADGMHEVYSAHACPPAAATCRCEILHTHWSIYPEHKCSSRWGLWALSHGNGVGVTDMHHVGIPRHHWK